MGQIRNSSPYYCQADYEYWQERKKSYVPTPKLVIVRRPVYQSSVLQKDMPWLWAIDRRETSINLKDWEMNVVPSQYAGAAFKRNPKGHHALDWCSCFGLSSWYMGHGHDIVTTVDTNKHIRKLTKANLKALGTNFYDQQFIDINCDKYTLLNVIDSIDWGIYDTIRIGSDSYMRIFDAINNQVKSGCNIVIYKPTIEFQAKLEAMNYEVCMNPKGVDYFTKR